MAPSKQSTSRWRASEARRWSSSTNPRELGSRVYGARLLGADRSLVLAGGGNCSLKATTTDLYGESVETLFVKASGVDLAAVESGDFTPLALAPLRRLLELPALADDELSRALLNARLDPRASPPSVETLLHALVPFRYVDHTHADAFLAWVDRVDGAARAEELYGEDCLIVPYENPGFALATRCRELWRRADGEGRRPRGIVLLHHGLVSFADDANESYETMLELVDRAARRLPRPRRPRPRRRRPAVWSPLDLARARAVLSSFANRPLALTLRDDASLRPVLMRPDLGAITRRGPLTPDHLLLTGRRPLVVTAATGLEAACTRYSAAVERELERRRRGRDLMPLDTTPRVLLVPGTGLLGSGRTPREAALAAEVYAHTLWAIERAEASGGYRPLGAAAQFEFEHWGPERAKRERAAPARPLTGRVALVTGAASGIGRAAAEALLARGAAVVGVDLRPAALAGDFEALTGDARSTRTVRRAIELAVRRFGGVDIVVANAGIFFAGPQIAELADTDWRRTFDLNLDAQLKLLREAIPFLRVAPAGGSVIVVGSKNVPAPGPGAAAYSASKAALTQLARVAALELARDGVRVNVVHPDAVFDTGVWTPERLAERAAHYGMSIEAYRRRNLLRREVHAADVGALVAELAGDLFAKTTGAQIPVDGGNERVI